MCVIGVLISIFSTQAYVYFLSRGNIRNDLCTSFECYWPLHIHVDQSKESIQKAVVILFIWRVDTRVWPSLINYITEKQVQAHLAILVTEHYSCIGDKMGEKK